MKLVRFCRTLCLISLWSLCTVSLSYAQGFKLPTQAQLDAAPKWQSPNVGLAAAPAVDLRQFMPPIGNQGRQGSCTGWATAYYARTIMQKISDAQWDTQSLSGEFSPSFVYHQVNGGLDRGANLLDCCELMTNRGCATLATMPYLYSDYRSTPPTNALLEASRYKIGEYFVLRNGGEIREALSDGYMVVIGVRTNPHFCGGHYPEWSMAEWRQGERERRNFGFSREGHALCVIGYDDTKNAFLIANSWGYSWRSDAREPGFFWADYEAISQIALSETNTDADTFVSVAIALKPPTTTHLDQTQDFHLETTDSYYGRNTSDGQPSWRWTVYLSGAGAASVKKVVYHLHPSFNPKDVTVADAATGFALTRTGWGTFLITADVYLADNPVPIQKQIDLKFRSGRSLGSQRDVLALINTSHMTDQTALINGQRVPLYDWTAYISGPQQMLEKVQNITYHLHPTFRNPVVLVKSHQDQGFPLSASGWGNFNLRAEVLFKDGTKKVLTHLLNFD